MTVNLHLPDSFKLGVIEGFFGIHWSWEARKDYASFLKNAGFCSYIYAPKADKYLRKHWTSPFPEHHHQNLFKLAEEYKKNGIEFGIGLSPYELYKNYNLTGRQNLHNKISAINDINPDTLCILFDDMSGEHSDLAKIQCEILEYISTNSIAKNIHFCPTYYSFDPILTRVFGPAPEKYLEQLGEGLPDNINIFWTGTHVISRDYTSEHLETIRSILNRKPVIWDNYPVNDSQQMSNYLNLSPPGYDITPIREHCSGHYCNPMNQPYLSMIPIYGLALKYFRYNAQPEFTDKPYLSFYPEPLYNLVLEYLPVFEKQGLESIPEQVKNEIYKDFKQWAEYPAVIEIFDWLSGAYTFDPECLT